jgi:hypothetical protein
VSPEDIRAALAKALAANEYRPATHPGICDALAPVVARIAAQAAARPLSPVREAALVLSDRELSDALGLWYAARREADDDPARPALGGPS